MVRRPGVAALWVAASAGDGWKRFAAGLAMVVVSLTAGLLLLSVLADDAGVAPYVRDIRGWAIAAPVLTFAAVMKRGRVRAKVAAA